MKTFTCQCGNLLYFENSECLSCGRTLGVIADDANLYSLEPVENLWRAQGKSTLYRKCKNYEVESVCNWLVPADDHHTYCLSCRLNKIIPNLSNATNHQLWSRIESAKRRLIYTLVRIGLPIESRYDNPVSGLAFKFMEDQTRRGEFTDLENGQAAVMTGHQQGIITINIAEADHIAREAMRLKMNEAYRTLLGHFRHEIGHYYWTVLIEPVSTALNKFRQLFGDERADYAATLKQYYVNGAPANWSENYISAYATSHPWEDWAETWANYLHIVDTLETAYHQGFQFADSGLIAPFDANTRPSDVKFDKMIEDWRRLSLTLNELNRSMGLPDAYPFILGEQSIEKLRFIHHIIHRQD